MKWSALLGSLLVLSAILFAVLLWFVWQNRGGERVPMLFLKAVVAPLAATFFLLAVDYFKPVDSVNSETNITFFKTSDSLIANRRLASDESLPPLPGGYVRFEVAYGTLLRLRGSPNQEKEWEAYRDILETGFVDWLSKMYSHAWQIEQRTLASFIGAMGRLTNPLPDREKTPTRVSITELGQLFGNQLIVDSDQGAPWKVSLPSGADLRFEPKTDEGQRFLIETPYVCLSIAFKVTGGGKLKDWSSPRAQQIAKLLGEPDPEFWIGSVVFTAMPNKVRRWAGRTEIEMKWARQMADAFERDFGWQEKKR